MPDLSALERSGLLVRFAFWNAVFDLPVRGHAPAANLKHLVRLIDKSVVEYEALRRSLVAYTGRADDGVPYAMVYLRASNHIETCINALHRAIRLAKLMQRAAPWLSIRNEELPRTPDVKRVENLRHAFEHTSAFLADGRIPEGDWVMPHIWPEGVEFVGDEIRFAELAAWLRRLHALGERLTDIIGQEPPAT
jgi:hypothetical protein